MTEELRGKTPHLEIWMLAHDEPPPFDAHGIFIFRMPLLLFSVLRGLLSSKSSMKQHSR
jgi:hypothetical protein